MEQSFSAVSRYITTIYEDRIEHEDAHEPLDRDPETVILLDPRLVGAAGHVAPPILMVKVPVNCPAESCLEPDAASIAEFDSQL